MSVASCQVYTQADAAAAAEHLTRAGRCSEAEGWRGGWMPRLGKKWVARGRDPIAMEGDDEETAAGSGGSGRGCESASWLLCTKSQRSNLKRSCSL
jgi:hypothetical protein